MSKQTTTVEVELGRAVYDSDDNELGIVRGVDEQGFYVAVGDDVRVLEEETTSADHGEAIMWRCWECGEMGQIENIPEECTSCGAPKEDIYYWQED